MSAIVGDLRNCSQKLKSDLRSIKYPVAIKVKQIIDPNQNPAIFLQILHYTLIDYNKFAYESFIQKDYELFSKNDLRFLETIYKILIKEFSFKPNLTLNQFFSNGFLEHKIILCINVIKIIKRYCETNNWYKSTATSNNNNNNHIPKKQSSKGELQTGKMVDNKENSNNIAYPPKFPNTTTIPTDNSGFVSFQNDTSKILPKIYSDEKQELSIIGIATSQSAKTEYGYMSVDSCFPNQFSSLTFQTHDAEEDIMPLNVKPVFKDTQFDNMNAIPSEYANNQYKTNEFNVPRQEQKKDSQKEILKMILDLNSGLSTLTKKFDEFHQHVNKWMVNINAKVMLLETNVKLVKAQLPGMKLPVDETIKE